MQKLRLFELGTKGHESDMHRFNAKKSSVLSCQNGDPSCVCREKSRKGAYLRGFRGCKVPRRFCRKSLTRAPRRGTRPTREQI